jgi:RNA polymerase sigma-70 factor (ECF subfamily)
MAEELEIRIYRPDQPVVPARVETAGPPSPTLVRTVQKPEDADLVHRAREGDPEAFHLLYVRHAPSVRRFLGGALRDPAAADDALQETFARAHRKLRSLRDTDRLRPWLLGMARIVALDELGRERRTPLADVSEPREEDFDPLDTPEELLLSAEAESVLRTQLDRLSPARRAALLMRLDHDLDYPEIAQAMGWALHKVKNEIHRARIGIRAALLEYLGRRR